MKIHELRLGNWWDNREGGQYIIDNSTMIDFLNEASDKNGEISIDPIPLNEQWLKDFGFEDLGNKSKKLKGFQQVAISESQKLIVKNNKWEMIANIEGIGGVVFPCPQLKYVHQLQNLYFCLTGKELTK